MQYDKFKNTIDMLDVKIIDDNQHIQGLDKHTQILTSTKGDSSELRKIYRSTLIHESPKYENAISISNIDEHCSFLNLKTSLEPTRVIRSKDYVQTIKLVFDDGELICTPWTNLCLSDKGIVMAKDVKSYSSILGYNISDGKLYLVSKYVKDVHEYGFVELPMEVSSTNGNIAVALNSTSGIFVSTNKNK
jgi:hypothetical protein